MKNCGSLWKEGEIRLEVDKTLFLNVGLTTLQTEFGKNNIQ